MQIFFIIALCILRYNIYNSKEEVLLEVFFEGKSLLAESAYCIF